MIIKKASEAKKEGNLVAIIYGAPGVGKTTMTQTLESVLLIDLERGYTVLEKDIDVAVCDNWKDIADALTHAVKNGYKSVVIDSTTRLTDILAEEIMSKAKISKLRIQDYGEIATRTLKLVWDLKTRYGMNVVLIAHESEEKDEDGGSIFFKPLLSPKSVAEKLPGVVDVLGRLVVDKAGKRHLCVQPTDKFKAKCRIKSLKSPCSPDFAVILDAYQKDINAMTDVTHLTADDMQKSMSVGDDTTKPKIADAPAPIVDQDSAKDAKKLASKAKIAELKKVIKDKYSGDEGQKKYTTIITEMFGVASASGLDDSEIDKLIEKLEVEEGL